MGCAQQEEKDGQKVNLAVLKTEWAELAHLKDKVTAFLCTRFDTEALLTVMISEWDLMACAFESISNFGIVPLLYISG